MKTEREKALKYLAKAMALSNAESFIGSHGEEGFSFEDKEVEKAYKKEIKILAKQLGNRSNTYFSKHRETGFEFNANDEEVNFD